MSGNSKLLILSYNASFFYFFFKPSINNKIKELICVFEPCYLEQNF